MYCRWYVLCLQCFPLMFCVYLCLLKKHTGSISSVADFFFPLFPTGHGLLAVIFVYKGGPGTLYSANTCVLIHFLPFEAVRERS